MIRFEVAAGLDIVRLVMTEPSVWRGITDDTCPPAESFRPLALPSIQYVLAFDDEELLGLWMLAWQNGVTIDIHTCLLPSGRGPRGLEAAKRLAEWIWENTRCQRITTSVPAYNRLALRFAERAGMTRFGVNEKSFLKHGKLHDQILLGLSRPEGR
ncbi:MAG TPA: GNAT family protein [Bryobacteraceae bacterium]|nr:GNAT family protein [Bryobacteraceae bacterium]